MRFDPFHWLAQLEQKRPALAKWLAMILLSCVSPFNAHLGAKLLGWDDLACTILLKRRRGVRNHVATIHAGALFTLGETCAGLVIIRNFPFEGFRPLMSDVRVSYLKQARDDVTGEACIPPETIASMHAALARGEIPTVEVVTDIYDTSRLHIAAVTTVWQVKPWKDVRSK
jgi:acyl-coenzyme A thioesterase PaaI-like protein